MKIDISPEEAEYLLDAVDTWTDSKESLRKRLVKVAHSNVKDLQNMAYKAITDPRVDELISEGHSASVAIAAVMSNNMGIPWESPLNPLTNKKETDPVKIIEADAKRAQERHEERQKRG